MSNKVFYSKEEEIALGKIIKAYVNGDVSLRELAIDAHNKLFEANKNAVYHQIQSYYKTNTIWSYEYEDAIQDGLMELSKRIWEYNPDANCKCYTRIYYFIAKSFQVGWSKNRSIPLSTSALYENYKINKLKTELEQELGRESTLQELSEYSNQSVHKILNLQMMTSSNLFDNKPSNEEKEGRFSTPQTISTIPDDEDIESNTLNGIVVDEILSLLNPMEQDILKSVYGLGTVDLNAKYGIYEKSKINRLAEEIMSKLRFKCKQAGYTSDVIY